MIRVLDIYFSPLQGFIFSFFVFCLLGIGSIVIRTNNIRPYYFLNKSNYFSWSNDFMESRITDSSIVMVNFLCMQYLSYTCIMRINNTQVKG